MDDSALVMEAKIAPLLLHQVTINHFRSLFSVGPITIQEGLTVAAGQNDGGKSAFLDALAFLLDSRVADVDDRWSDCKDTDEIEVIGLFLALPEEGKNRETVRVRTRQCPPAGRFREVAETNHVDFPTGIESLSVVKLKEQCQKIGLPFGAGTLKAELVSTLLEWTKTRGAEEFIEVWRPITGNEQKRLPTLLLFSSQSDLEPEIAIQNVVRAQSKILIQETEFKGQLYEIQEQLDKVLKERIAHIEDHIRKHCEDIEQVTISARYAFDGVSPSTTVLITQSDRGSGSGQAVSIAKMGDGRRRRVNLAIYEAGLDVMKRPKELVHSYVVVYDEPDTHMDHLAQRKLFGTLDAQSKITNVQVIVATHSKSFIDSVHLEHIINFHRDEHFKTSISVLKSSDDKQERMFQSDIYLSLGFRNSTLLDEKCFLVVEGETELNAIPLLYPTVTNRSIVASGIHIVSSDGCGAMNVFLTRLKRDWNREVFVLLDQDERTAKRLGAIKTIGLTEHYDAFFIGAKELEDAFCDDVWIYALTNFHPVRAGEATWQVSDITPLRSHPKFSESLLLLVQGRCDDPLSVTKPVLGRSVANACIALGHMPPILASLFANVGKAVV